MSGFWTESGPISLPSRPLVYGAGLAMIAFALMGVSLGFQSSYRKAVEPEAGAARGAGADDAQPARPIVDLAPTTAPPAPERNADDEPDTGDADADTQTQPTASDPSVKAAPAPDAAPEKAAAPTKTPDDASPAPPVKSDVPF
jgi:hypothetical protein